MSWLEKVSQRTGRSKEDLRKMSWVDIEQLIGIEIKEPPEKVKRRIKGSFFARRFRWMTKEEVKSTRDKATRIVDKILSRR